MKEYPKAMYHEDHGMRIFQDAESIEAAGEGWQSTPIFVKDECDHTKERRVDESAEIKLDANENEDKKPIKRGRPKRG